MSCSVVMCFECKKGYTLLSGLCFKELVASTSLTDTSKMAIIVGCIGAVVALVLIIVFIRCWIVRTSRHAASVSPLRGLHE